MHAYVNTFESQTGTGCSPIPKPTSTTPNLPTQPQNCLRQTTAVGVPGLDHFPLKPESERQPSLFVWRNFSVCGVPREGKALCFRACSSGKTTIVHAFGLIPQGIHSLKRPQQATCVDVFSELFKISESGAINSQRRR